jgi:CHAD domain-containing protein
VATYRWHPGRRPRRQLRRVARAQVDRALAELELDDPHEAVHAVRKRGKKLRALLRLVREDVPELYEPENLAIRDAARRLAGVRDAAVALETFEGLLASFGDEVTVEDLRPVWEGLVDRRAAVAEDAGLEASLGAVREELEELRSRIDRWDVHGDGFDVLAGGLAKTYGRCRDRLADAAADPTTASLHEWRKRVKYHRYHLKLVHEAWPQVLGAHRQQLHELSDLLGDDHDLALLRTTLHADPQRFGGAAVVATCTAILDRRRAQLQADAHTLGHRCFAEPTDAFVGRVRCYWAVAASAPAEAGPLADPLVPPGR